MTLYSVQARDAVSLYVCVKRRTLSLTIRIEWLIYHNNQLNQYCIDFMDVIFQIVGS